MPRQHAALLHRIEHEIGVDGVAREAEPPARVAEPHLLDAVLDLEPPGFGRIAGKLALDAVFVGRRMLDHFKLGMACEHLKMHAADPMPPRADLAVGHCEQISAQRPAEGPKDLLRRVERDAAHQ